jgi:hypothetical protein
MNGMQGMKKDRNTGGPDDRKTVGSGDRYSGPTGIRSLGLPAYGFSAERTRRRIRLNEPGAGYGHVFWRNEPGFAQWLRRGRPGAGREAHGNLPSEPNSLFA